jgi:aminoglycoside phosphotransferase (APT) family kinase protein
MAAVTTSLPFELSALMAWMDARGLGHGPLSGVELLGGGTQNVLLRFDRAGRGYVLRHPPVHKRPNSDETMRREARVLAALAGTDVPHPALIAAESELGALGAAFYLMEPVAGANPSLGMPAPLNESPELQRRLGLSMADAIAALARVDPQAAGIADLGRAEGWLERQVPRWRAQLESYRSFDGYDGPQIPGVDEVATWLESHRPARMRVGVIHGDFHFANVLADPETGELTAVVDWELATIGHPLLDLGHLLATWPSSGVGVAEFDAAWLPTVDEVISRYGDGSGLDLDDLLWFRVLACYRLGLILEGTHARAAAGLAPLDVGDRLHGLTVSLLGLALELIGA